LVEISEIFSETTLGMKKLLSRNISYIYGNPKYPPLLCHGKSATEYLFSASNGFLLFTFSSIVKDSWQIKLEIF
jgi:hypothetical protein